MKALVAGSALGAAILAGPAMAATTGTVAVTSEYMFRGIVSEGGAAVQGSLDWSDSGFYAGAWASNSNPSNAFNYAPGVSQTTTGGGNELDLYGGYKFTPMEGVGVDLGAIYYLFTEDEQVEAPGTVFEDTGLDYFEVYGGFTVGGFGAKLYYADNYFNVEDNTIVISTVPAGGPEDGEATYLTAFYDLVIEEGLNLKGQIGVSDGDGVERFLIANFASTDDSFVDYSLTLTKALDNGFSASFALVDTDIESNVTGSSSEDKPKFVVTLAKGFEI